MTQNMKSDGNTKSNAGGADEVHVSMDHDHAMHSKNLPETALRDQLSQSATTPSTYSLCLPRVGSSASISSLTRRNAEIFENEAPSTASSRANDDDLENGRDCHTPLTPRKWEDIVHESNGQNGPRHAGYGHTFLYSSAATRTDKPTKSTPASDTELWSRHNQHSDDDAESVDSVEKWLQSNAERNYSSLSDKEHGLLSQKGKVSRTLHNKEVHFIHSLNFSHYISTPSFTL